MLKLIQIPHNKAILTANSVTFRKKTGKTRINRKVKTQSLARLALENHCILAF